jgi:two-component system sensor histidine kinase DesK
MQIDAWLERSEGSGLGRRFRMRVGILLGLLFLAGPVSDLVHEPRGGLHRAALAVGLAGFVFLYAALLPPTRFLATRGAGAVYAALATLAVLATGMILAGAPHSFVALFVYFVAAGGLVLRPTQSIVLTAVTTLAVAIGVLVAGQSDSAAAATALTVGAIGAMMSAFGRQVRANRELRVAREELARLAVSEERLRIARDLHDLLGHTLSVIALKSELAAKLVERDPKRAAAELHDVQAVTRQALAEVREAVHAYRHLALDEALEGARTALAAAGIECRLDEERLDLPSDVEAVLAWAVREGTTNVVRHSHARRCAIRVSAEAGAASVEVEDDGAGTADGRAGSGLAGLAERAERVRGRLEAGVRPGGGFRLRLTVPLPAS